MGEPILKTCPFCGRDVHIEKIGEWYHVVCGVCGATQNSSWYKHDVVEAWNQREGD